MFTSIFGITAVMFAAAGLNPAVWVFAVLAVYSGAAWALELAEGRYRPSTRYPGSI